MASACQFQEPLEHEFVPHTVARRFRRIVPVFLEPRVEFEKLRSHSAGYLGVAHRGPARLHFGYHPRFDLVFPVNLAWVHEVLFIMPHVEWH